MEPWREELYHHGIKGQKWGVRRYQNKDGSWTSKGKVKNEQAQKKFDRKNGNKDYSPSNKSKRTDKKNVSSTTQQKSVKEKRGQLSPEAKRNIKIGVAVAGTAVAAYGAYKISKMMRNKKVIEQGEKKAASTILAMSGTKRFSDGSTIEYVQKGKEVSYKINGKQAQDAYMNYLKDVNFDAFDASWLHK